MRVRGTDRLLLVMALIVASAWPATAQQPQEFAMDLQMAPVNEAPMDLRLWAGAGPMRVDMNGDMGQMSMIWSEGTMLMVQHAQRSYMEVTREMIDRMAQMMSRMGRTPQQAPETDVTQWTFERSGATDTINGMSAFEVKTTGPEGQSGALWMTTDGDIGLFEALARLGETFQSMGIAGTNNPMQRLQEYAFYARAQGLPEGRVIRVLDGKSGTIITVTGIEMGPFAPETWAPPAEYTRQQMPMMPR